MVLLKYVMINNCKLTFISLNYIDNNDKVNNMRKKLEIIKQSLNNIIREQKNGK